MYTARSGSDHAGAKRPARSSPAVGFLAPEETVPPHGVTGFTNRSAFFGSRIGAQRRVDPRDCQSRRPHRFLISREGKGRRQAPARSPSPAIRFDAPLTQAGGP